MNLKNYFYVPSDDDEGNYKPVRDFDVIVGYIIHLLPYINCAGEYKHVWAFEKILLKIYSDREKLWKLESLGAEEAAN